MQLWQEVELQAEQKLSTEVQWTQELDATFTI